jgi:hypothetical protein
MQQSSNTSAIGTQLAILIKPFHFAIDSAVLAIFSLRNSFYSVSYAAAWFGTDLTTQNRLRTYSVPTFSLFFGRQDFNPAGVHFLLRSVPQNMH